MHFRFCYRMLVLYLVTICVPGIGSIRGESTLPEKPRKETKYHFRIESGDAKQVLELYGNFLGRPVIYMKRDVQGVELNGLEGEMTIEQSMVEIVRRANLVLSEDMHTGAIIVKRTAQVSNPPPASDWSSETKTETNTIEMTKQTKQKSNLLRTVLAAISFGIWGGQTVAVAQVDETPSERIVELDAYTVRGFRDTLQLAREEARNAPALKSVIASDAIGQLPDANIADALKRVTSVYLRPDQGEGRYVSIRGVDPILNNVTVNGQTVAVSDTDGRSGRAAPLDVLSSSATSRIEISKVSTPDMDAQGIGGTINIKTPSAFDFNRQFTRANFELGYNDFATETDIYSFNIDYFNTFGEEDQWALYVGVNNSYREYLSHLYENPLKSSPENDGFGDIELPDRVRFGSAVGERERYGYDLNLEYAPDEASFAWFRVKYSRYTDIEIRPEYTIRNRGDIGALSETEFFYTRYRIENETRHEKQERPMIQYTLGGKREISDSWEIEGNLTYSRAKEENPWLNYYETETQSDKYNLDDLLANPSDAPVRFTMTSDGFASPVFNAAATDGLHPNDFEFHQVSRLRNITSEVEEETMTANADATWNGEWNGKTATFKTGFKALMRDKSVDDNDTRFPYVGPDQGLENGRGVYFSDMGFGVDYEPVSGITMIVPSPEGFIADRAANPDNYRYHESSSFSNSVEDDYELEENIYAVYAMGSVELKPGVSLIGGVRIEKTDAEMEANSFIDTVETENSPEETLIHTLPFGESEIVDISSSTDYTNILPSLILKWDIDSNWLFRTSVSSNIGRPDYPDVSPISTLEVYEVFGDPGVFTASNEIGNPDLEPYKAYNFDASLDYFFNNNAGVASFGVFYKKVDNAIYSYREEFQDYEFAGVLFDDYTSQTVNNADSGYISGVEFAIQYDFDNGFGFLGNVAFMDSEVEVFEREDKLPFFNQADLIYNLQVYYENNKFSARLAYNFQSEAIFDEIGGSLEDDIYRADQDSIDFKLSYTFNENWSIYLTGKNMNNEPDFTFYRNSRPAMAAENPGYEIYGREFRLGVTWSK